MDFQPKHTLGLVLFRTNYGENDRIVTFLTKDYGKVRAIVKGVRKERAKLAGGVELFSVSEIGFVLGRGELATVISARLVQNFGNFLDDLAKVDFGFNCLKTIHRTTADACDCQYFNLVESLLKALNEPSIDLNLTMLWWHANLSKLTGHNVNLHNQMGSKAYESSKTFTFDVEQGYFVSHPEGIFTQNHLKLLRLAQNNSPRTLARVEGGMALASDLNPAMQNFVNYHH